MSEEAFFTKKKSHVIRRKKCLPTRPRKCSFAVSSPTGAQAVSFLRDDCPLSPIYNRQSNATYMEQCFEIIGCIGYGCFGVVFKVNSREDGKLYAVKKSKERFRNAGDRKRKLREVERLQKLPRHPNCVQLYCAWEENGYLFLQIELCEVSLAKYTLSNHEIPEEMVWNVLVDIALALKHLHDREILHLDIKLDNILMCNDGSFKLSDFGISLDCSQKLKDAVEGDPKYIAPELLSENFTKSADIFSFGISLLEFSFDINLPEHGVLWRRLREGQIPQYRIHSVSNELFELLKWMMHPEPDKRPTANMILEQTYIRKILLKRKLTHLVHCLVAPGKFLVSFLTFFGKVGYDIVMAALLRLHPPDQDSHLSSIATDTRNDLHEDKGSKSVATSTPVAVGCFESNKETPIRLHESWGLSDSFDPSVDLGRLRYSDETPIKEFLGSSSSNSTCTCCKRRRIHPYDKLLSKFSHQCDKRYSTVRNLTKDFSQFNDTED